MFYAYRRYQECAVQLYPLQSLEVEDWVEEPLSLCKGEMAAD
jgi:hypothetical protein